MFESEEWFSPWGSSHHHCRADLTIAYFCPRANEPAMLARFVMYSSPRSHGTHTSCDLHCVPPAVWSHCHHQCEDRLLHVPFEPNMLLCLIVHDCAATIVVFDSLPPVHDTAALPWSHHPSPWYDDTSPPYLPSFEAVPMPTSTLWSRLLWVYVNPPKFLCFKK